MLTIKTPGEYVNQPDIAASAGSYIRKYGNKAFLIGSRTSLKAVGGAFYRSLEENGIVYQVTEFSGFPTKSVISRYAEKAEEYGAELILGVGGGKVNDVAKGVGTRTGHPVVAVPTIAATCASWAACSILYDENGSFESVLSNNETPRLILADTRILATAPERYMNAGIIDTLAKWYETAPHLSVEPEDISLNISVKEARTAYEILLDKGERAVEEGKQGIVSQAAIDTVDAIIWLAGLVGSFCGDHFYGGFAHPFYNASTRVAGTRQRLHGEKVAFGLIIQKVLEAETEEAILETIGEFNRFQAAFTLEDLGIEENKEAEVRKIAGDIVREFSEFYAPLNYGKTEEEIITAIYRADELVKRGKSGGN